VDVRYAVEVVDAIALVRLTGAPTPGTGDRLRAGLLGCLAQDPDALVVDLSRVRPGHPDAAAPLRAVAEQAARWPGTAVLVAGADEPVRDALARMPRPGLIAVHDGVDDAMAAARAVPAPRRRGEWLQAARGTPTRARDLVTEACLRWDLPDLVPAASVITTELVTNAVQHAGGCSYLTLSLDARFLRVSVRDSSDAPPVPRQPAPLAPNGRGLLIVDSLATGWGYVPYPPGKVVWASLRVD